MSCIKFVYFDLGNVILNFSHQRMIDQVAAVAGVSVQLTKTHMFDNDLENRYETGELNSVQFREAFCELSGGTCDHSEFMRACGDIFWLNAPTMPIISQLSQLDIGMGVLSNTCQAHWDWVLAQFPMVGELFPIAVTSFEARSMKPDAKIYQVAIEKADFEAEEILFVDDKPENIAAAKAAGMKAFVFTDADQMLKDLASCGVRTG